MPRYASFGRLDSQLVDDGDTAFVRINQRLRPDQLKPGEVAVSQNGRMDVDGAWQPRLGYYNVFKPIATGTPVSLPQTLPFSLPGGISQIYGSCIYSDPNTASTEYLALATDSSVKLILSSNTSATPTSINYPSGEYVDSTCEIIQAFEKLFIFRNGKVAMRWPGFVPTVTAAVRMGNEARLTVSAHHHVLKGDIIIVSGLTFAGGTNPNGTFTVKSVTVTQIRYDCAGSNETFGGVSSAIISSQFALVDNGAYTQPLIYDDADNTDIVNGIVTVTATAHEVAVGDKVMVSDAGATDLNPLTEYVVYEITDNTFLFKADASDYTNATIAVGKRQSIGLGFTHMPAPPWAIYHQRRLWMPFNYAMTGTSGTPTITNRNTKDEIIASDILDENTYDQISNQFRIASGSADFIVALQPFSEDNLVAFARNSIHLVRGVGADLTNATVQEITREVGCVSRKSIAQVGNQIFFLSDNGVYGVAFEDLYNLRGATVPLSESINPLIARINRPYANNAVGVYHDNRYYLAVPLDTSTVNNTILVYNFLNQGWESMDIVNNANWNITGFIRSGAGGPNKLHAVSKEGGIHLIDTTGSASPSNWKDFLSLTPGSSVTETDVSSLFTSRQYSFGTMDRKKFNSYELHLESATNTPSNATLSTEIENPDATEALGTVYSILGKNVGAAEDVSLKGRMGNLRGYGGQMSVTPSLGRPKVRAVRMTGMLSMNAILSAE
jgi:hypothetical protein